MKRPTFPLTKPVMVISDYPLQNEIDRDIPFSGASHLDLLNGLAKAGIHQKNIATTYLSYERPEGENYDFSSSFCKHKNLAGSPLTWIQLNHQKDCYVEESLWNEVLALVNEIKLTEPKLIILSGKWSFFFLTGLFPLSKTIGSGKPLGGLSTYRASICKMYEGFELPFETILYPVYPAITKHRLPELSPIMRWDSLKAGDIFNKLESGEKTVDGYLNPEFNLIIGDTYSVVSGYLTKLSLELNKSPIDISVDIETRHTTIDCIGIGYKPGEAICIPFSTLDSPHFWTEEQELDIITWIGEILTHDNARIIGQNFSYDAQYLWKFWLLKVHAKLDTMIANHVLHNKMRKSLDVLASVYCEDYTYWKNMQDHSMEGVSK